MSQNQKILNLGSSYLEEIILRNMDMISHVCVYNTLEKPSHLLHVLHSITMDNTHTEEHVYTCYYTEYYL
jgi:hypothetical protein